MALTPLALENADVLRRLDDPDYRDLTFMNFAQLLGRDASNLRKTLHRLHAEGMVLREGDGPWMPDPDALAALDRLDGTTTPASYTAADPSAPARWPHAALVPDPLQPRKAFDPDALADLARSIAAAGDVLTPLLVLPPDASGARTIKAGERRWRAVELLMNFAVEGCVLPPALDPLTGGGLPIRQIAPQAADTAWIALTENGNREPLNPIEDGEALLALMQARGWSARQAAHELGRVGKSTGQPGAGADGVKTVQERVKVAREATPADKARFLTDPDFTWKDLLATVQAAKAEPAAEAAPDRRPGDFVLLTPEITYDLEAMGWGLKGLEARIELARDPEGGWRYGYRLQHGQYGHASASPGYRVGEGSAKWSRIRAFATVETTLRNRAADWQGSQLPLGVRLLQWLTALGDGTADPADIPPRKPTTWDAEAARIRAGEGGATAPAQRKEPIRQEAAEPALFEEDAIPPYLQRLAGGITAADVDHLDTSRAFRPDAAEAQAEDPAHPGEGRDRTVEDILGPLTLMQITMALDPQAPDPGLGRQFLSGLFARVGFQPPFTASQDPDEAGVVFDGAGRCVLVCDANGDATHPMATAQAIVTAAALNAAVGLTVDVAPAVDAETGAAA